MPAEDITLQAVNRRSEVYHHLLLERRHETSLPGPASKASPSHRPAEPDESRLHLWRMVYEQYIHHAFFSHSQTTPPQNVSLYAKWIVNSYVLEFVDHNGTVIQTGTYVSQYESRIGFRNRWIRRVRDILSPAGAQASRRRCPQATS
ncbi:MAG: hypothetical protein MZU97_12900 [Bacillus subtilis]|nr:hypothetical protein [Bacillus subtilis]